MTTDKENPQRRIEVIYSIHIERAIIKCGLITSCFLRKSCYDY